MIHYLKLVKLQKAYRYKYIADEFKTLEILRLTIIL